MNNFIKIKLIVFVLLSWFNSIGAEYKGKNIDGIEFDCSAYSYESGSWYYVTVEFDGDQATITFDQGDQKILTLDEEAIDDPNAIEAFDYNKGVYWELEVDGLDE